MTINHLLLNTSVTLITIPSWLINCPRVRIGQKGYVRGRRFLKSDPEQMYILKLVGKSGIVSVRKSDIEVS